MVALSDASLGIANEATPGTYATPTRWPEVLEPEADVNKSVKQGQGLRVGSRVDRSARRVVTSADAVVKHKIELTSKGMGLFWESALGSGTSALVSGSTYQQLFTPATGITIPSRTVQTGVIDASGNVNAVSYLGCMVPSWDLELPNDDIGMLSLNWDAMNWTTAQAYASPSYAAAPSLFHFGVVSAVTLGGAVTVPTATALATGGTASTAIRSVKISADNQAVKKRFNFNGGGRKSRQLVGDLKLTGELEIEYVDNTIRDAFLNDTALSLSVTITTTEALSTGFATFQLVLPEIKLNGEIPKANGYDLPVLKVPFDILDNLTASAPIYVVHRTADTAL